MDLVDVPQYLWYIKLMSIIFKNRGAKRYAYISQLEGNSVRQRYIGSAEDPTVVRLLQMETVTASIPAWIAYLFWDTKITNIHVKKHARSVITRILELGDKQAVEWMQMTYPGAKIVEVLLTARNVSDKSRQFWKLWYGVEVNNA